MFKSIRSVAERIQEIGSDPLETEEARLRKRLFVSAVFLVMAATAFWGITYLAYHETLAGALSLGYSLFALLTLVIVARSRRIRFFLYCHLVLGMALPFVHTLALGGLMDSSVVILWSLMSPLAALLFLDTRRALGWWLAFLLLLVLAGLIQPAVSRGNLLPAPLVTAFFILNIGGVSSIVLVMLNFFQQQKNEAYRLLRIEQEKGENLLLNILPREIAAILKNEQRTIADHFEGASILFADLVGFTPLTASLAPVELVSLLNQIFTTFDDLVEKYDLEKIRTIGDNYMVASGVPRPRQDHAQALACMALEMREYIRGLAPVEGKPIQFRIGINSGPVVGGVIGRKKFVYDLWGDAVNVASRMESQGLAGKIQVTQSTYELIRGEFCCEPRGKISVKGRGEMDTWFLLDKV